MIQRVQSLFLLGTIIFSLLLLIVPVYEVPVNGVIESVKISKSTVLEVMNWITLVLSLAAIFLYKNRNLQIRLCNLTILLLCIFIGLIFFMADTMTSGSTMISYAAGIYFPIVQIIFNFIASRFIKKDENLVRSADRLR